MDRAPTPEPIQHVFMDQEEFPSDNRIRHSIQYADGVYLIIEREPVAGEMAIMFTSVDGVDICGLVPEPGLYEATINLRILPAS